MKMRNIFLLIRKFVAVVITLFSLTGLFIVYESLTSNPPDYSVLIIVTLVMALFLIVAFLIFPKKVNINKNSNVINPDCLGKDSAEEKTVLTPISLPAKNEVNSDHSTLDDYLTDESKKFLEEYSSVDSVISNIENINILNLKSENSSKKNNYSKSNTLHSETIHAKKNKPYFPFTARSYVVGIKYENRNNIIKRYINKLKKDGLIYETYEGLRGKDLKEQLEYIDIVWEIEPELVDVKLVEEKGNKYDSNAIAVYLEDTPKKIGYIPKSDTQLIKNIINKYEYHSSGIIKGGKYKKLDWDNKIYIDEKTYSVDIELHYRKE